MHGKVSTGKTFVILLLAILGASSMLYFHLVLFMPRVEQTRAKTHLAGEYFLANDFYPIWLTSRRWLGDRLDPYSPALTQEIQIGLLGRSLDSRSPADPPADYRAFAYPAYTDLLFWPVSEVPFRTFRIVWVVLLTVLLAAAVLFWVRVLSWRLGAPSLAVVLLLTICSYQELEGLYAGQLGLLVGFLLGVSLLALMRNRPWLAGTSMALAMIKPQMVLLAVGYLILWSAHDWRRRRGFPLAFLATMAVLMLASLMVWPHWIPSWIQVLRGYPRYSMPPLASEVLGSTLGDRVGMLVIACLLAAALAIAWRGRGASAGSHEFWLTLSVLLALTTITLVPGQSVCDHVILLPGIFLLMRERTERPFGWVETILFAAGAALVLWPWVTAFILIVLRPFLSSDVFYSKAVFALPLRTTAAFPFVVLGLLTLALRRTQVADARFSFPG
jgi:hypothetical protein